MQHAMAARTHNRQVAQSRLPFAICYEINVMDFAIAFSDRPVDYSSDPTATLAFELSRALENVIDLFLSKSAATLATPVDSQFLATFDRSHRRSCGGRRAG